MIDGPSSVAYIAREIAPPSEGGVNFGSEGIVLARSGTTRLVWRGGGTYWSGMQGNRYSPSSLSLLPPLTTFGELMERRPSKRLTEGGRLSINRLRSLHDALDAEFGRDATERIAQAWRSKRTAIFTATKRPGSFQNSPRSIGTTPPRATEKF